MMKSSQIIYKSSITILQVNIYNKVWGSIGQTPQKMCKLL